MSESPPAAAQFFAGSDDEDAPMAPPTRYETPANTVPQPLFLADSDDESEPVFKMMTPPVPRGRSTSVLYKALEKEDVNNMDTTSEAEDIPRASSYSSPTDTAAPTPVASSRSPSIEIIEPPPKKRKLSPSASDDDHKSLESCYIGSFVVGNAWSTVKGRGYVTVGETIGIERDGPSKDAQNKTSDKSSKPNGKKKQATLTNMMKPALNKKSVNTVVRLVNNRGFEFGRLPTEVSTWVSQLLDLDIVEFKGSTMIDCPATLHSGADLIVSLSIYLCASAFQNPNQDEGESSSTKKPMFNEGQETLSEQTLRQRMKALINLFDKVGLRPRAGVHYKGQPEKIDDKTVHDMTRKPQNTPVRQEVVGDGEVVDVEEEGNISEGELSMIYRKAQANDRTMAEMDPPKSFTLTLRGYQKQALFWMHSMENGGSSARETKSMHPLWSQYAFPTPPQDGCIDLTDDEKYFYFNPFSGEMSLDFPKAAMSCKGGILADEMGMGKTIMLSALIQSEGTQEELETDAKSDPYKKVQLRLNNSFRPIARSRKSKQGPTATLIVAPASLLNQWAEELKRSSEPGTMEVTIWHGQNRLDLEAAVDDQGDDEKIIKVIITSYGVLASEHAKLAKSDDASCPVYDITWLRVVLDEAHHCKSRQSKTAKAVFALRARRRWAVTGSPLVNNVTDLYSLLKFLDFAPWSNFSFFRSFITLPFLERDPKAIQIVQVILESVLLRREKNMLDSDGKRIVTLPDKEVNVEHLEFPLTERRIYDAIYIDSKRQFDNLYAKGLAGKQYTHILALLMRLRRACLHPSLVLTQNSNDEVEQVANGDIDLRSLVQQFSDGVDGTASTSAFAQDVIAALEESPVDGECPICLDVMQSPVLLPTCLHQCCKECIVSYITTRQEQGESPACPTCMVSVQESDLIEVVRPKKNRPITNSQPPTSSPDLILRRNDFQSSTKVDALIKSLRALKDNDSTFRAVVFSQFTSFLDLIGKALTREGLTWLRFDGSMDIKKKNAAVNEFRAPSTKPKVFIVSLKAGGVGLNLTCANHVYMMDCWWNAAIENQAIDRVHRIGQDRTVHVTHYIISDTIEGRILKIQKRKTAIVREAFRGEGSGHDSESLENLKIMFGDD